MSLSCAGCSGLFKSRNGLSNHKRTCKAHENFRKHVQTLPPILGVRKKRPADEEIDRGDSPNRHGSLLGAPLPTQLPSQWVDGSATSSVEESVPADLQPPPDNPFPLPSHTTRRGRQIRLPRRFQDMVPSLPTPLSHIPPPVSSPSPPRSPSPTSTPSPPSLSNTDPNSLGLFRQYLKFPGSDPEDTRTLDDYCQSPGLATSGSPIDRLDLSISSSEQQVITPTLNKTTRLLLQWFYSGSATKSLASLAKLVKDVLLSPHYDPGELRDFSASRITRKLDEAAGGGLKGGEGSVFSSEDGWRAGSVKLSVPIAGKVYKAEDKAPTFTVDGIQHRSLISIMKDAFRSPAAESFHFSPFKLFWQKAPGDPPERVITELYNSDAFIEEHTKLQQSPREPGCNLEAAIAAFMIWSDSTHLANFGTASLWPIYCYFGNQSKYSRAKPSSFAAHHLAYIPSLPDSFQDWYRDQSEGTSASAALVTHLKRELCHATWLLLLDEDFCSAYVHGLVVQCADGVARRLFPRLFTYSADYPEKALLSTIRFLGGCPCPRCKIKKGEISGLGSPSDSLLRAALRTDNNERRKLVDKARKAIFNGKGPGSAAVEKVLQPLSMNAFSIRLSKLGFDYHRMFVPDLLHEFELGTWKATFAHLIRILRANGDGYIQKLNWRYRRVPTFGDGTIRIFSEDASAMKKLAARDFEDLLQCAMPVFESLLPAEHDTIVLDLLFIHAKWHALAKLRLHTETTLKLLDNATMELGEQLRRFRDTTCSHFYTQELPHQEAAQGRRAAKLVAPGIRLGHTFRHFNLLTYKLHSLGDYTANILLFGTSDGYSTQIGELEHRRVKRFYVRTNKRSGFAGQITKHEQRERLLHRMAEAEAAKLKQSLGKDQNGETIHLPFSASEPLAPTQPGAHYDMSRSQCFPIVVPVWLSKNAGDPATVDFLCKLKEHLLERLEGISPKAREFSINEKNALQFAGNRIYRHKYLRVNYTSYDVQRCQDSINPRTHPDILILADNTDHSDGVSGQTPADKHPYLQVNDRRKVHTCQMDFLWIRWLVIDTRYPCSLGARRLPRLEFPTDSAFDFIDPSDVLRGTHLIPSFSHGRSKGLGYSTIYTNPEEPTDWNFYYANIFVDRDMYMRYQGGGVGHGDLGPPLDETSLLSRRHAGQSEDIIIEQDAPYANDSDENNSDENVNWDENNDGDDDFGTHDNGDADLDGEDLDTSEWAADRFGMDELYEDGEGQWNGGSAEADGYGSL
ncbi:hypothetical protein Agabi119p4_1397 [Agaricus bisporus var. burnettii]|uniref:C2H2-type domain-containing protein n=1 Tax=Agaricus bisporus var. burnettii TaxID=192524 RepID=A0A8H7KMB3_AGABI|nr:hypothetical protein Agabi119p4_1397 [Agaricus bisporus var. burnettii]